MIVKKHEKHEIFLARDKYSEQLTGFPNEFNEFIDTGAQMQDSIYHMTLKSHFISKFCTKTSQFRH